MSVDTDRWQKAQTAEANHPYHSSIEDKGQTKRYLRKNFQIEWGDFNGKRILEVGSGTGHIHSINNAELCVGVDPLYTKIDTKFKQQSCAELTTAAGEKLPFRDDSFDIILCINVLDHSLNPDSIIKEMARVLKSDGRLLFQLNVFEIPKTVRSLLTHVDKPHPHHFSTQETIKRLNNADLSIVYKNIQVPEINKESNLKRIGARVLLRFRMIYIIAQHN